MADRVFLHVGVPKSGTTYLQTTMWHNRPELRAQGVLYPGRRRMDHFHACQDLRGKRGPRPGGPWDRLRDEVKGWDGTGLVTHEFFSMATAEQAQRAVADLAPAEVSAAVHSWAGRALAGRTATTAEQRAGTLSTGLPGESDWTVGYLMDVVFTRDVWMHRVDLSRATG